MSRIRNLSLIFSLTVLLAAGCSFGSGNIETKHSSDLEARRIRRIAVVPQGNTNAEAKPKVPFTSVSASDLKSSEQETSDVLARLVYSTMTSMPGWQIVSESEVRDSTQSSGEGNELARVRKIGEMVYADAILTGRVLRYRERVGNEFGAKSPASVAFTLNLIDVRRGDTIWSARFDETQRSLSENIFGIGDIMSQGGIKWLTAEQLTREGVKKAMAQLHEALSPK